MTAGAELNVWARQSGSTLAQAREALDTARRLTECPDRKDHRAKTERDGAAGLLGPAVRSDTSSVPGC